MLKIKFNCATITMKTSLIVLFLYCSIHRFGECARILGVFQYPSYSHQIVYQSIWNELADRGHELLIFTANPQKTGSRSNLREIDISFMYNFQTGKFDVANLQGLDSGKMFLHTNFQAVGELSEKIYQHPEMQSLFQQNNLTFDLLMVDIVYPTMIALSVKFQCPYVGLFTMDLPEPLHKDIGNYYNPVVYTSFFYPLAENLSFWERLQSVQFSIWYRYFHDNVVYATCDKMVRKYLGKDYPPVKQIIANISAVFYNSNPVFAKARLNIPTVIDYSGLHIKPTKPIPQNIKSFLDDAPNGVIYFSLGSNIKSTALPPEMKAIFLETIRELKYKVLWKYEEDDFTNLPSNLKIVKWLPQQDILAHPNVKVFLTQGGLQSLEEALSKRVPMVSIPFFADQSKNGYKMESLGIGKKVERTALTKDSLKQALMEVAENKKYRINIKRVSELLEDQQVKPMDKIIWWTEYIIRHKGCTHLRSPFLDIPFYQYHYLDIVAFWLLLLVIFVSTLFYLTKYVIRHLPDIIKLNMTKLKKA